MENKIWILLSLVLIGLHPASAQKSDWNRAVKRGTEESYEKFILKYGRVNNPKSKAFVAYAKDSIEKIKYIELIDISDFPAVGAQNEQSDERRLDKLNSWRQNYSKFINKYPNSSYLESIDATYIIHIDQGYDYLENWLGKRPHSVYKDTLMEIYDQRVWNHFISYFVAAQKKLTTKQHYDSDHWQNPVNLFEKSLEVAQKYKSQLPDGAKLDSLESLLPIIHEETAWHSMKLKEKRANNPKYSLHSKKYREFIERFPDSKYANRATAIADSLVLVEDEAHWRVASKPSIITGGRFLSSNLENHLDICLGGHIDQVRDYLAYAAAEKEMFNQPVQAFSTYLANFPNGFFFDQAKKHLANPPKLASKTILAELDTIAKYVCLDAISETFEKKSQYGTGTFKIAPTPVTIAPTYPAKVAGKPVRFYGTDNQLWITEYTVRAKVGIVLERILRYNYTNYTICRIGDNEYIYMEGNWFLYPIKKLF